MEINMSKLIIAIISTLIIGTGGYIGYQQFVKPETEKVDSKVEEKMVSKKVESLEKQEVQEILEGNINSLFDTLKKLGNENGWGPTQPADYEKVKPEILPYVTEEFAELKIKELVKEFYCDCDTGYKPKIDYNVRFSFEQPSESVLEITALETATDIENMGVTHTFQLIKENGRWKMNDWEFESLDGKDIQLTKEEAEKILSKNGDHLEFIKEYDSKKAGGKAYLFNMKNDYGEFLVAISSKDTKKVSDYEVEKEEKTTENKVEIEPEESTGNKIEKEPEKSSGNKGEKESKKSTGNKVETIQITNLLEDFHDKMNFGKTKEELVSEFGQPISEKETSSDITLEYSDAIYTISQVSGQIYKVQIVGEKASSYYKNFDEVLKAFYPDPNPVYAAYGEERTKDENGYHLNMIGFEKTLTFTSKNENGAPISSITIQQDNYK